MSSLLWALLVLLLLMWVLGMSVGSWGAIVHLLPAPALVVLVINIITGRRTV